MLLRAAVLMFIVICLSACLDQPECINLNNNVTGIGFRDVVDGESVSVLMGEAYAVGANADTIRQTNLSRLFFVMDQFEDQTTVRMTIGEERDSIVFGYNSKSQFASEDCGERYVLSGLRVVQHSFDSLRIINSTPAKDSTTVHIEIFF